MSTLHPVGPGPGAPRPGGTDPDDARRVAAVRRVLTAGLPPHSLDRLTTLAAGLLEAQYATSEWIAARSSP